MLTVINKATVRVFEVLSEIMQGNGSLHCTIINLYVFLASWYKLQHLKENGHQKRKHFTFPCIKWILGAHILPTYI